MVLAPARAMLRRVDTYSVVVAIHIIAVLAAYGLPLTYPLLLPYLRARHPEALPGVHAIQYRLNVGLTGPATAVLLVAGLYLASSRDLWGEPFVLVGLVALALIAVVGGAVITPSTKRLAALEPSSAAYAITYRRYMASEVFLGAVVLVAVFAMAAKPFS